MREDGNYKCDFCEEIIHEKTHEEYVKKGVNGKIWSVGNQGRIEWLGMSGSGIIMCKYACPNPVCQARLLIWTKS